MEAIKSPVWYLWWALLAFHSFVNDRWYLVIAIVLAVLAIGGPSAFFGFKLKYAWLVVSVAPVLLVISSVMFLILYYVGLTKMEPENAQIILREGKPHVYVIESEDYVLDSNREVKQIAKATTAELKQRDWPDRKVVGGERWYWRTIESVFEAEWDFLSTKEDGLGVVSRPKEKAKDLYLGVYAYGVKIQDEEFVDRAGTAILLELKVPARTKNLSRQWLKNKKWFSLFHGLIASSLRDWVNSNDYNEMTTDGSREIQKEIVMWLQGLRPGPKDPATGKIKWSKGKDAEGKEIRNVFKVIAKKLGVRVVPAGIAVEKFIQAPKYREAQTAKYTAERKAEADTARASGFVKIFRQMAAGILGVNEDVLDAEMAKTGNRSAVIQARKEALRLVANQQALDAGVLQRLQFDVTGASNVQTIALGSPALLGLPAGGQGTGSGGSANGGRKKRKKADEDDFDDWLDDEEKKGL